MKEKYWKQFENSGKIEDYLSFVSSARQEATDKTEQMKVDGHAGIYHSDRNYTEADPGGGIRQTYQPFD